MRKLNSNVIYRVRQKVYIVLVFFSNLIKSINMFWKKHNYFLNQSFSLGIKQIRDSISK